MGNYVTLNGQTPEGEKLIEYIESLVLLRFNENEKAKLLDEISKIIDLFNELRGVPNLDQYEPLYHVHDLTLKLRDDEPKDHVDLNRELLQNNAVLEGEYVRAPKTVV